MVMLSRSRLLDQYRAKAAMDQQRSYAAMQASQAECGSQIAGCDTAIDQPEFARLNGRFSALLSEACFNRDRIGNVMSRLGRGQPEATGNGIPCPTRCGVIGIYEDRLDDLDALNDTLRNFANVLETLA